MTTTAAVDQSELIATVRVTAIDGAEWTAPLRRRLLKLRFRLEQAIGARAFRKAVRLYTSDRVAFAAFLAGQRKTYDRIEALLMTEADAEAVPDMGHGAHFPAPPVPSEWFAPKSGKPNGVVFYVHGGSFIAQRSPRITALVGRFAAAAKARVVAPNYRLAPEHPCPAAVDDVVDALRWFNKTWPDEAMVALAESSGAAVLLAALQRIRGEGEKMPAGIVLLSPWVDLSLQSWSVVAASLTGSTPYTMESLALMVQLYLQDGVSPTDPVASPLFGDFAGFPPMLVHASKGDILYDDAVRLADRLRDSGGELTMRLWADERHVWERTRTAKARQSVQLAAQFIRQRLDA